jgi:hypothetical protein
MFLWGMCLGVELGPTHYGTNKHSVVLSEQSAELIFGPEKDNLTNACKNMHNEELHNLYSSSNYGRQNEQGMWNARED